MTQYDQLIDRLIDLAIEEDIATADIEDVKYVAEAILRHRIFKNYKAEAEHIRGRAGRDGKKAYAVLLYNEAALTALKKRVIQGFPDKNYIRQVYRLLGDFFGLEEGLGHGLAFEFDPEHFVKTYKLELTTTLSAIKVLQVAGYLECTTEVHARSRISFLVLRDQLYKIELGDLLLERLVEYILRNYPVGENKIRSGIGCLADWIERHGQVVIDGYGGVFWDELVSELGDEFRRRGKCVRWFRTDVAMRDARTLEEMLAPDLGGEDPLFGRMTERQLRDWFDPGNYLCR